MDLTLNPYLFVLHGDDEGTVYDTTPQYDTISRARNGSAVVDAVPRSSEVQDHLRYAREVAAGASQDRRAIAEARNRTEVLRARHLLSRVEGSEFAGSEPLGEDARFYNDVLGTYWRWYHARGLPFPQGYAPEQEEPRGLTYAR